MVNQQIDDEESVREIGLDLLGLPANPIALIGKSVEIRVAGQSATEENTGSEMILRVSNISWFSALREIAVSDDHEVVDIELDCKPLGESIVNHLGVSLLGGNTAVCTSITGTAYCFPVKDRSASWKMHIWSDPDDPVNGLVWELAIEVFFGR